MEKLKDKKKVKIVLLPTNNSRGTLYMGDISKKLQKNYSLYCQPQHLYFISNDEIKEGDWYIVYDAVNRPFETKKADSTISNEFLIEPFKKYCFKVIVSTDMSLKLPLIPVSFVEKYVERYNISTLKDKEIKEVMIEMEDIVEIPKELITQAVYKPAPTIENIVWKPKTRKDNTVIVSPIKDSWSREEIRECMEQAKKALRWDHPSDGCFISEIWLNKMFNNNIED